MSTTRQRLAGPERREAILGTACRAFALGSYRGTTTAEIAREAGISEPILYRHFESKRELYIACLERQWTELRDRWEDAIESQPDSGLWLSAMGAAYVAVKEKKKLLGNLWLHALSEVGDDDELRRLVRAHVREVHTFVTDVIRRAQQAGGMRSDLEPRAEAWLFIATALLGAVGRRLGGVIGDDDFAKIVASRQAWLTGS